MEQDKILLCLPKMGGKEKEFIEKAFRSNWIAPLGPNVDGFEEDLERFLQKGNTNPVTQTPDFKIGKGTEGITKKRVAALSSGTSALHLGLVQAGVQDGDEVIVQSLTFSASANAVVYQRAIPVFVDSEEETWNISPSLLDYTIKSRKEKTGKLPKAIIPVHLYGMPAKIEEIMEIAAHWKIPVIEDSAEAFGSRYKNQNCGTFGLYSVLSFNGNKMITTSGGGALVCPGERQKKEVVKYATQSREDFPWYEHQQIGFNYRLSNVCAGIGRGQMYVAEEHIAHHKWVQSVYHRELGAIPGIRVHDNPNEDFDSNFWLCTIQIDKKVKIKGDRNHWNSDALRRRLGNVGIESRLLWNPMHRQPFFRNCPACIDGTSNRLFENGLCLPSGPWVEERELERIINEIKASLV